jgi:magnesium transporter
MALTHAARFREGQALDAPDASWIEVLDPGDRDYAALQRRFGLHTLAIRSARCAEQVPKLDVYGDQIFVVLKLARLEGDQIVYAVVDAFVSRRRIVTVRQRASLEAGSLPDGFTVPRATPDFILHALMNDVVMRYFPVVQMIEDQVLAMEQRLVDAFLGREEITRLFRLRREAIHLQHVLARMADVCAKLAHLEVPCIAAEARPHFRDVHGQLERLGGMTRGLADVIRAAFEASSLLEQQRQGASTRKLAAWAAMLGAPTAIAAIYDMNFPDLPGVGSPYGLPAVLGVMAAVCGALYLRFRKLRWL